MTRNTTRGISPYRLAFWLGIAAASLLVIGANAHLVYVATQSQPDCVDHVRGGSAAPGQFAAARSACTSR